MDQDFDAWATKEIATLRAKADALELALKQYRASHKPRGAGSANGQRRARGPGVKTGAVLTALKGAGSTGLTNRQIINQLSAESIKLAPPSLRSMLWNWRKQGLVKTEGDKTFWIGKESS